MLLLQSAKYKFIFCATLQYSSIPWDFANRKEASSVSASSRRRSSLKRQWQGRVRASATPKLGAGEWIQFGLMWLGRIVLMAIVAASPWYYGSATWAAQFWLLQATWLAIGLTLLTVLIRPSSARNVGPIAIGLAAWLVLGIAQVVPLPDFLYTRIAAAETFEREVAAVVSRWDGLANSAPSTKAIGSAGQHLNATVSIDPAQTSASIAAISSALVCLVAATHFFTTRASIIALLLTIAVVASTHSFVGLIESVSWNHQTLLPMPHESNFSTFVSRNSAPQLYATAIGCSLALLGISVRKNRHNDLKRHEIRYPAANILGRIRRALDDVLVELDALSVSAIVTLLMLILGIIAAASRGGALSNLFAGLITGLAFMGTRSAAVKITTAVLLLGAAIVLIMSSLHLDDQLISRFESLENEALSSGNGRLQLWGMSLSSLSWYWLFGCGIGTYHFGILPFHVALPNVWNYHAENIPIEILCESGIVGSALLVWVLVRLGRDLRVEQVRRKNQSVLLVGVLFATSAIGLHSLVDFSLILPGVFLPFLVLLGAFYGERQYLMDARRMRSDVGKSREKDARRDNSAEFRDVDSASSSGDRRASIGKEPTRRRSIWLGHVLCAAVAVLASWIGFVDLSGYAAAESLAKMLKQNMANSEPIPGSNANSYERIPSQEEIALYADGILELYPRHPEVNLQAAIAKQFLWQESAMRSWNWENASTEVRRIWSNPRLVASAFRGPKESGYTEIRNLAEADKGAMALAREAFDCFRLASLRSPLDWRASLRKFHGDFGWQSADEQTNVVARIFLLAGECKPFALDVGQLLLREQQKSIAFEMLRSLFASQPSLLNERTLSLIVRYASPGELLSIASSDLVAQAELCRLLAAFPHWSRFSKELAGNIREKYRNATAETPEGWLAFAWIAHEGGDKELEEQFLSKATELDQNRHDVRFQMATFLAETGRLLEAKVQLERCLRQAPGTPVHYLALLEKVKLKLDQKH